ncbi:beta strand repeat-containing protein [Verrucomicrobium spinosum]|uniref:beta strand repeat-containing protein n=1 Tax=Verrucomicrobium spinosum TaxID=2736 RepID=UPI0001744B2C|nr:autotransporter-associated beta strand repeat-containing protein [Verrucomicrobium spinosum]
MTPSKFLLLCSAVLFPAGNPWLSAAPLTWDVDPGTSEVQDGGGNWLDANRWLSGGSNQNWADGNDALFGGGSGLAGTVTLAAPVIAGSLTFNAAGSGTYTLSGSTLTLSTGNVVVNVNATINSILAGSAGLTKTGAGVLTLGGAGANTYTGLTTISEGGLNLNKTSGNAVGGDIAITNGGRLQMTLANQVADTAAITMSGATSVFNGTAVNGGQSNQGETFASLTVTGGAVNSGNGVNGFVVTGATTMTGGAGNTIFVGNSGMTYTTNSLSLTNINSVAGGNVAAVNTFTVYGNTATRISSLFVGNGGITLNNSRINLRKGSVGTAGAKGSRLVLDGDITTTGTSASFITLDTAASAEGVADLELSSTSAAVTRTFNIGGGGANLTIDVRVTNGASAAAGILKQGAGQLTFSGDAAYTGITTIREGILAVAGSGGKLSGTSAVVVSGGGTLHVGSGTATSSLNNGIANRINPAASLALGGADASGGNVILAAAAIGNTHAQSFSQLSIGTGVHSIASNAATGTNTLTFDGAAASVYTRSAGGYVNFGNQAGFGVAFTNAATGSSVAGTAADAVLIGATMNNRTDFVTAAAGTLVAATYTSTGASTWMTGKNMDVTGDVTTGAGDAGVNSLRFNDATARSVTLDGTQTLTSGMILNTANVGARDNIITGGVLKGAAGGDLLVIQNNASGLLTISSDIQDNGSATALTKVGAGVLVMSGTNTYTGTTYVLEGTLRTAGVASLGAGNLLLNGGVYESNGTFDRSLGTGDNQVQITGGVSGFSAFGGSLTINLGGAGGTIVWGTSSFQPSTLVLNGSTANASLDLLNGLDLNGAVRTISVGANVATLSGQISNTGAAGSAGLTKTGTGALLISSANSYDGVTTITAGALQAGHNQAFGTSTVVLAGGELQASGGARVLGNQVRVTASSTISGSNALTLNGTLTNGSTTPSLTNSLTSGNVLTLNGNVYLSEDNTTTGRYLQILGSGSTVINGVIANNSLGNSTATGLFLNGGRLQLTADNTYTGRTLVANGPLVITRDRNLGIAESTPLTDAIILAVSSKLRIEGTFALDVNRSIGIGNSSGGAATGTIEVAAGQTFTVGGTITNRTVNVDGSAINTSVNGPSVGSLTKADSGRLVLSGNNTYSGLTTVSNGILLLRHGNALGTTEAGTTVGGGASLQLAGDITVGAEALTINGSGLGGVGALRNAEGNNTWGGLITLGGTSTRINSDLGTLTLDVASGDAIVNTATTGTRTLSLGGTGQIVVVDAINQSGVGGTLAIVKDGVGTVTLSGTNNINGNVTVNSGRLVLDYSSANTVLQTDKALTFNGGTIEVKAQSGGSPILGNITLVGNSGLNKLVVGEGTTLTLGNTWTRNSTSLLLIDLSAAGSVLNSSPATETKTIASSGTTTRGMIVGGGFAAYTVEDGNGRYDFAALSGGSVVRLDASLALPATGGSTGSAYLLKPTTGSSTLQFNAGVTVNTAVVRVDTTEAAGELDLNGGKLVLNDLGFLVDGSNNFTIKDTSVGQTGLLEGTSTNTALFMYHYGTGTLTITAKLSSGGGSVAFIGEGGLVDWNSASNSTGSTNIQGAVVRASHVGALSLNNSATAGGGTQFINLSNGGILELATGNLTRNLGTSGNGVLGFQAGDGGGFSAFGADRTVNFTSGATSINIVWGSTTGFLASGSKLILGSKYANKQVDLANSVDLNGGNQVVDVQSTFAAGVGGKLSGVISGTTGSLQKIGQGILEVTGNNTYGGGTTVSEGTLLANNSLGSATGTGNVTVLSGARLGGNGTVGASASPANLTVKSGGILSVGQLGNTSGQQLKLATGVGGVITLSGTVEFDIFGNNGGVNPIGNNDSLGLTSSSPIALGGTLKIVDSTDLATELTLGSSWQLIDWTNVIVSNGQKYTGGFTTFDVPVLAEGLAWDYSQLYTTGYVSISVVPEPGRVMLLAGGLAALLLRRRRRQRA